MGFRVVGRGVGAGEKRDAPKRSQAFSFVLVMVVAGGGLLVMLRGAGGKLLVTVGGV